MEIAKIEIAAIQEAAEKGAVEMKELHDLELSLVGGGCGDISLG
jgi:hypothetical protein